MMKHTFDTQDNDTPIERIDPPFYKRNVAEVKGIVSQRLMPILVMGERQYYISARHGYILDKDVSEWARGKECCLHQTFSQIEPVNDRSLSAAVSRLDPCTGPEQAVLWCVVGRAGWEAAFEGSTFRIAISKRICSRA